jgi:hypothetical protein
MFRLCGRSSNLALAHHNRSLPMDLSRNGHILVKSLQFGMIVSREQAPAGDRSSSARVVPGGTDRENAQVHPGSAFRENATAGSRTVRAENRKKRGDGKPETFNVRGFTHICGKKRSNGRFTEQTICKRLQAKLSAVKIELKRRLHDSISDVGKWLRSVVGGHIRYYVAARQGPVFPHLRFALHLTRRGSAPAALPTSGSHNWVTQLLRQGDAKVFKKYSQMKLQMKFEALIKLNRQANEQGMNQDISYDRARVN